MSEARKILTQISSTAWEHPADRAALTALRKMPGFEELLKYIIGGSTERSLRLIHLSSAIRVSYRQFPRLNYLLEETCKVLDYPEKPELYVAENPFLNAGAIGVKKPFIVLNSSVTDFKSDAQLMAIIGHELGHIMSGHVVYKTLLNILLKMSISLARLPITGLALTAIIAALNEWDRKSELSADRAGLLTVQDIDSAYNLLIRMSGGRDMKQIDLDEFFAQAEEYESGGNVMDSLYKFLNIMGQTHPFPVLRLKELRKWVISGEYDKILNGEYPTRDKTRDEKIDENFTKAGKQYKSDFEKSEDPLTKKIRDFSGSIEDLGRKAKKGFEDWRDR